jgi:selenide, water dikinase
MENYKLTQFSHSSGCGCKIAPDVLEKILKTQVLHPTDSNLIVGNNTKDDAAVYNLGNGTALISTVDFFMPIVDDPFDFGKIAAANAISDVYAMGGKPILATALLGWPVNKLPPELAQQVLDGARTTCNEAGIPLAGGHSIDSPEPMFGLSVNGIVALENIKKNSSANKGDLIYITKNIGVGILATALKRGVLAEEDKQTLLSQLSKINSIGAEIGSLKYVSAMTDITGFGLLGHLIEMAEASNLSAEIYYDKVPLIPNLAHYTSQMIVPDNLYRNWNSFEKKVHGIGPESFFTLNDPQTNGGLMVMVAPSHKAEFEKLLIENQLGGFATAIGKMTDRGEFVIEIL